MTRTLLAAYLALTLPSLAIAGPRDRMHEKKGGEKRALRDDLRDARLAEQLLRDFEQAAASRDAKALGRVELRVWLALNEETTESDRKAAKATRELQESDREVQDRRREVRENYDAGQPGEFEHDRHELNEARQGRADNQRDVMRDEEYRQRVRAIRQEWARLQGARQRRSIDRKHELLVELVRLSHYEIHSDVEDLHEDRRER